jgi:hypothetical protein
MRPMARAYSHHGHGPRADQTGRIHISDFRYPAKSHLQTAAGPYIRVNFGSRERFLVMSAIRREADSIQHGRSALFHGITLGRQWPTAPQRGGCLGAGDGHSPVPNALLHSHRDPTTKNPRPKPTPILDRPNWADRPARGVTGPGICRRPRSIISSAPDQRRHGAWRP